MLFHTSFTDLLAAPYFRFKTSVLEYIHKYDPIVSRNWPCNALWITRLHLISKMIQTVYAIISLLDKSCCFISFRLVSFPLWHFCRPDRLHSACKTVFDFADVAQRLHLGDLYRTLHVRNRIERCTIRGPRDGLASHHLWKWTGHTVLW